MTEYQRLIANMAMTLFAQLHRSRENMDYAIEEAKLLAEKCGIKDPNLPL